MPKEHKDHPNPSTLDTDIGTFLANGAYVLASGSQVASDTVLDETVLPAVPTNLRAQNLDDGIVRLSWTKSSLATGYKLYRNTTINPTVLHATLDDVAHYLDLATAATYHYRLKASYSGTDSDYSADVRVVATGG